MACRGNLDSLQPQGPPLVTRDEYLSAIALSAADGTLTAYTAHREGRIDAWDPVTGTRLDSNAGPPADRWVNVLAAGEMYGRQVLAAGGEGVIRLWSPSHERTVAEMHIETTPQDLLLTSDGYVCIATVMGEVTLHVPDWSSGGTG